MLTNRELASLFWLVVLAAWILSKPDIRSAVGRAMLSFLSPKLLVPFVLFVGWMLGAVWVYSWVGLWQPRMAKDTLFWAIPAFGLFVGATKAAEEERFFRRRLLQAAGLTALAEFYLNFATLDLVWELVLQPVIFLLSILPFAAGRDPGSEATKRWASRLLAVIVVGLFVPPTLELINGASTIDVAERAEDFALPFLLTAAAMPVVYALSLYASYEVAFIRMSFATPDRRVPWKARLALISTFHLRHRAVHTFAGTWPRELVEATSLREARKVIREYQATKKAEAEAKKREAEELARLAGVKGTDAEGHQLDRREFKETCGALGWLHTLQFTQYQHHGGRYQRDLANLVTMDWERHGLPEEHGITLKVSRSGQSWFAWRRTPSGWCFAIGAEGPSPEEWYFDGPEPPQGFPGHDQAWDGHRDSPTLNWISDE